MLALLMAQWADWDPFAKGFSAVLVGVLLLVVALWLTIGQISKILSPKPVQTCNPVCETTEWINFVICHTMQLFDNEEAAKSIAQMVTAQISPRELALKELGDPPIVHNVTTLDVKEVDDIRVLVPIEWINGPSVELKMSRLIALEFDLVHFYGVILLTWPGKSDRKIEVKFNERVKLDFDFAIKLFGALEVSLTKIPMFGYVVKQIVALVLSRKRIKLELPALPPNPNANLQ